MLDLLLFSIWSFFCNFVFCYFFCIVLFFFLVVKGRWLYFSLFENVFLHFGVFSSRKKNIIIVEARSGEAKLFNVLITVHFCYENSSTSSFSRDFLRLSCPVSDILHSEASDTIKPFCLSRCAFPFSIRVLWIPSLLLFVGKAFFWQRF